MGWERPNVFAPEGVAPELDYTWGKPSWIAWTEREQRAARAAVALFDQTSFGKLLITGRDAVAVLQYLCTANVDVEVGRAVYTGMLNERGGYEADVTITRLAFDEFMLVTSAASPVRDQDWIRRHVGADQHVSVVDVTSSYAVFGVMGPRSRDLLSSLTRADLSDEAFAFSTSQQIDLGYATVRATRLTYVGELGWELYVPADFAVGVYEQLMAAGASFGIEPAGYYTINSMRLEKGYRAFGSDLTPDYTPVDAGLLFACKLKTDIDFLGRAAVEQSRAEGARRKMVSFVLDDPDVMMWGGELVLRDGVAVGQVMSAAWGGTLGACVALAYVWRRDGAAVTPDYLAEGAYEINVGGNVCAATLHTKPPFDPAGERIKR
jgi:4-methylaminobutanoate oxidase (formaldehyde-forming)